MSLKTRGYSQLLATAGSAEKLAKMCRYMLRDQEVGGSNPLAPTNHTINGFLLQIASMLSAIGAAGAANVVFDEGGTIPETVICHCEDDNTYYVLYGSN